MFEFSRARGLPSSLHPEVLLVPHSYGCKFSSMGFVNCRFLKSAKIRGTKGPSGKLKAWTCSGLYGVGVSSRLVHCRFLTSANMRHQGTRGIGYFRRSIHVRNKLSGGLYNGQLGQLNGKLGKYGVTKHWLSILKYANNLVSTTETVYSSGVTCIQTSRRSWPS